MAVSDTKILGNNGTKLSAIILRLGRRNRKSYGQGMDDGMWSLRRIWQLLTISLARPPGIRVLWRLTCSFLATWGEEVARFNNKRPEREMRRYTDVMTWWGWGAKHSCWNYPEHLCLKSKLKCKLKLQKFNIAISSFNWNQLGPKCLSEVLIPVPISRPNVTLYFIC